MDSQIIVRNSSEIRKHCRLDASLQVGGMRDVYTIHEKSMRILFDYQIFYQQRVGGVSRYFFELIKALEPHVDEAKLSLRYSNNNYLAGATFAKGIEPFNEVDAWLGSRNFPGKAKLFRLAEKLRILPNIAQANAELSLKELRSGKYDVFHPTYYNTYHLDSLKKTPLVVTVYDMTHEVFAVDRKTPIRKQRLLSRADHVIAISESTRRDVINLLNYPEDRISTIHLGNSLFPVEIGTDQIEKGLSGQRYILFVGNRGGYKNFRRFASAIAPLLNADPELRLKCCGPRFSAGELEFFSKLGIERQVDYRLANDEQLVQLYSNALVFVFPSLYEGFGIPVLESFACRCPLASSNTSSLPEVAGDAALYFDPENEEEIRDCVKQFVDDGLLRDEFRLRGTRQLSRFSWSETGRATRAVYKLFEKS